MGLNGGKKIFYSWFYFTVLTHFEYSDVRRNLLKILGTGHGGDENSEDNEEGGVEGVRSGAVEFNVINSTENSGHAAMYSVWSVRRTGMKSLSIAILVHSGAGPSDYQFRVGSWGYNIAFACI